MTKQRFVCHKPTLKVLIFATTYFRKNLFSRELFFAIEILENFTGTYFHEFRDELVLRKFCEKKFSEMQIFENYARTYFREFRKCRPNRENKFLQKLVLAKISTFKVS